MTEQSPVERIKRDSRNLRGTLVESLQDPLTGAIREDDTVLIKFHGSYQQDDRDIRDERRRQKLEPAYSFMIRTRLPGGVCTPAQWLQLDAIATPICERHPAHHHAPGVPVPRRDQDRAEGDDAGDQRLADGHAGGVRRRQPQRDGEREPGRNPCAPDRARMGEEAVGAPAAADERLPRDLARRRKGGEHGRRSRAVVRPDLPAAQVQGRDRRAAGQRRRRLRARSRLHRHHRERRAAGFQPDRRWRHGCDARRRRDAPAPGGRRRFPEARAVAGRGRGRAHHAARLRQPRGAQACAPQVHDRRPRPRMVRRRDRAPPGLRARARAPVQVRDDRRSLRLDRGLRRPLAPHAAHRSRPRGRHGEGSRGSRACARSPRCTAAISA